MIKLIDLIKENNSFQYKIYCDVDGVLANFDKGFMELSGGISPSQYEAKYGKTKFWKVIPEKSVEFWANLEWMPGGQQLWKYIEKYTPKLLTAPSRQESSKIGKLQWAKKNIPGVEVIFKPAKEKHHYANENSILIDDRKDNIDRWRDAGGVGIYHTSTLNTIGNLKKLGL